MFDKIKQDIKTIMEHDPAARSPWEVYFLYSGYRAIRRHRTAHWLYNHKHFFLARYISQRTRHMTGIEIHPGAKIGRGVLIDHGMGVVIGETAEVGDGCVIYQGVTLGGTGKDKGKRHPTLGNNVMVGAGSKILGPFKVGDNSKIAANSVVLEEIPPNSTAVGSPARIVRREGMRIDSILDQVHVPDPIAQQLCRIENKLNKLEKNSEDK